MGCLCLTVTGFMVYLHYVGRNKPQKPFAETYKYLGVASQSSKCSGIGSDMMIGHGGSAVDAAIATAFCVGLLHGPWTGLGGGNVLTIYERPNKGGKKEVMTLIGRDKAPLAATRDMFVNNREASLHGGLAIAVPGELKALYEAWKRYGRLEWSTLIQPSIRLAEEGFPISRGYRKTLVNRWPRIKKEPTMREVFLKPNGELYGLGDILRLPKLAQTLRTIAAEGADAFYNGSLTDDIVADIQDVGGIITKRDLNEFTALLRPPVVSQLNGGKYTLYGPPPPSASVLVQFILNVLDGYNMTATSVSTREAMALTSHRIVEALKYGYGKRCLLGDEHHVPGQAKWKKLLTDKGFAERIRRRIDDWKTYESNHYDTEYDVQEDHGTHQLSVLSSDGAAVSLTSTINLWHGAIRIGPRTGILFNNNMNDFAIPGVEGEMPPSPNNFVAPGKRPMSSMSPLLVFDERGDIAMVMGTAGGVRIPSLVAQALVNTLWLGKSLEEFVATPRLHHQLVPNALFLESDFDQELAEDLRERGHAVLTYKEGYRPTSMAVIWKKCRGCAQCTEACLQTSCDIPYRDACQPQGY